MCLPLLPCMDKIATVLNMVARTRWNWRGLMNFIMRSFSETGHSYILFYNARVTAVVHMLDT